MKESLPAGWADAELGTVLSLANGFAFKPSHWGKSGLPIIRIQNLNNPNAPFNYYSGTLPEKVRVKNGDLLFAWSGTPGTSFGAHIWNGGDAWLNQHIFKVGFDFRLFDKSFLRRAINQNLDRYIFQAHGGAGLAHITKGMFESSTLQLCPLPEQVRIAHKLEDLLIRVTDCRSRAERIPTFLRRFRESVLAAACSGRLTADWRAECIKDLNSTTKEEGSSDSAVERITEAPNEWSWAELQSTRDQKRSICYGVIKLGPVHEQGVPCLRTSDVKPLRIDTEDVKRINPKISDQFTRTILRGGEVLVNVRGTLGGVAVVPHDLKGWNISREVAVVPISTANPEFIAYWIASLAAQNWLTSVVSLDLNTRGGRLSADIQAVVAADFIRNLREETKKGFYGRLKQGLYPICAPIGYLDRGGGHHVDDRLIRAVRAPGDLFLFTLEDEEAFLSLIWQESDFTRLLTPGQPRTLADVAGRMIANSWTFSSLCRPMGLPLTYHDPASFESFTALDAAFDLSKFDFIAVTPANDFEKRQSPRGTYYIYDGVHRALVLAHRVMSGQSTYRPVEALLLTPRRD